MIRDLYTSLFTPMSKVRNTLLLLAFIPLFSSAQTVLQNNGSDIYIQQDALIHVQGGFVNNNTDTSANTGIYNDGVLEIKGDFENKPGARFGTHTNSNSKERAVKLVGSGKQLIKGEMSRTGRSSFYNLVVDKAAATDTVEIQTKTVLEGSLVFGTANTTSTYVPNATYTNNNQKGIIKTYSDAAGEFVLDVENGSPDAIAGYPVLETNAQPNTGFILNKGSRGSNDGGLVRKVSSATSYVFPVGTQDKGFNGVRLNFSQVPGNGTIKMKFCSGSTNPDGRVGKISQHCIGCDGNTPAASGYNRYITSNDCNGGIPQWLIIENTVANHGYWSFESSNTGYEYDIEVFPNGVENMDMGRMWRVLKHEAAYGVDVSEATTDWMPEIDELISQQSDLMTYTRNGGCYSGNGIPGGHYKDFSHFTLGQGGGGNALPVELMYVKADPIGKHRIRVSWATALEINNRGFDVERSVDAVHFEKVGWVDGHNNSTVTQTYSFDDRPSGDGTFYYRLRQVDNDDAYTYSQVVQAKLMEGGEEEETAFRLYPNPTQNNIFLEVSSPVDEVKVNLYDASGQMVYENIFPIEENGVKKTLNVPVSRSVTMGTYVLTASTNGTRYSAKVVLQ